MLNLNNSKSFFLSFVGMYSFAYFVSTSSKVNSLKFLSGMLRQQLGLLSDSLILESSPCEECVSSFSVYMGF